MVLRMRLRAAKVKTAQREVTMSYQALYRKWRPTDFNDVKGQDHIVKTLKNQIKADRIGHAYLFCGTRGTGKTTVAKILAKAVNCEHPEDGNPCGKCAACRAIAAGTSMNVIEIDAASNNGVDNIRQIREEVQYSPTEGKYKVYIIDEVHMLSIGAFNALLKTLEEPPEYVIFILATTEAHKIPITILSRCQRYDFHRISIETIADRLTDLMHEEKINVEPKAIRYVAKAADGSMRDALSLLDQCIAFYLGQDLKYENVLDVLGALDTEVFAKMLGYIVDNNTAECIKLLEQVIIQGSDLSIFVEDFIWYLRNILLIRTADDTSKIEDVIDISADNLKQLNEDARIVDDNTLMRYIRILSELANDIKFSSQKRIKVEVALIKMTKPAMEQNSAVEDMLSRLALLEKHFDELDDKVKSGTLIDAAGLSALAGNNVTADGSFNGIQRNDQGGTGNNPQEKKRVIEALPEDIEQIAVNWDSIINSIQDEMQKVCLRQAHVTLAEDGISLEIMFNSLTAYNTFSRPEDKQGLEELIEERTGIHVNIIIRKLQDNEDFRNRFTDIREAVKMKIEVDDKEEFI